MIKNFTEEQEKEIIDFYLVPNTVTKTLQTFNITTYIFYRILNKYKVTRHDKSFYNSVIAQAKTIKLDQKVEDAFIKYYLAGHSALEAIKKFNLSNRVGYRILKEHNIKLISCLDRFITDEIKNKIIEGYEQNKSIEELSLQFKITSYKIKQILLKNNIPFHSAKIQALIHKNKIKEKYTITAELEQQIIAFYLAPHTKIATEKYFNIPESRLSSILKDHNIPPHQGEIAFKLRSESSAVAVHLPEVLEQQIIAFYQMPNSERDTARRFNIPRHIVKKVLRKYKIKKHSKKIVHEIKACKGQSTYSKFKKTMYNKYGVAHAPKKLYQCNNIYFDSFPELCFYLYHIKNNIEIKHEPIELFYYFDDKKHSYFPDFEVDGQLYEIKGQQFLKEDGSWQNPFDHSLDDLFEAKHQCAMTNKVKILYPTDYKKYIDWFNACNYIIKDFTIKDEL